MSDPLTSKFEFAPSLKQSTQTMLECTRVLMPHSTSLENHQPATLAQHPHPETLHPRPRGRNPAQNRVRLNYRDPTTSKTLHTMRNSSQTPHPNKSKCAASAMMLMMLGLSVATAPAKLRWCFGCLGWKARARLLLLMLGIFIAAEGKTQFMLMMLGLSVATPSARPGCSFR